jgi:queuosine biosynthesis protein QueC
MSTNLEKSKLKRGSALLVFSAGQDSTTLLTWALNRFEKVEAISFYYGQKHSIELRQGEKICKELGVKRTLIDISFLSQICDSALTQVDGDSSVGSVPHARLNHLPSSFVPNRNMIMLTLANTYAQKAGLENLVTGTCQTDFSGYSDCRNAFIRSLEDTLGYSTYGYKVHPEWVHYMLSIGNTHWKGGFGDVEGTLDEPEVEIQSSLEDLQKIQEFFKIQGIIEEGIEKLTIKGFEDCSYLYNFVKDRENSYNLLTKGWIAKFKDKLEEINPNNVIKGDTYGSIIKIHTPLMYINKAETFKLAEDEGCLDTVLKDSRTCYNGVEDVQHPWGFGCTHLNEHDELHECPACNLRRLGYEEYLKSKGEVLNYTPPKKSSV